LVTGVQAWPLPIYAGGVAAALLSELLELATARTHERELGRDKEPVEGDQQQQQDEQKGTHRATCEVILEGGSSSFKGDFERLASRFSASGDACAGGDGGAACACPSCPARGCPRRASPEARPARWAVRRRDR